MNKPPYSKNTFLSNLQKYKNNSQRREQLYMLRLLNINMYTVRSAYLVVLPWRRRVNCVHVKGPVWPGGGGGGVTEWGGEQEAVIPTP